ncbi:serine/threonine-protein kinase [Streptomyces sp. NBC_00455]|uniref:serine/threonine-protein kinase n=1 Tax=Streptomyces sp. NBC_00455 TaxID=2903654 RepID=UPI002E23B696
MSTPGRRIADRYRLEHKLAEGGFGRIWQAHDERLKTDVVVKEMRLAPAFDPGEHAKRLIYAEREARNAAKLRSHPHILPVYDVIVEDDRPWIVMELVRGGSLADRLTKGPLSPKTVADVAEAMLKALDAAHKAGVVHRDVKPANIMMAEDGRTLLTDFGIAAHQDDTRLTTVGNVIGTPEYLAPERINGTEAGPASDLFALGVTLYQAVEGVSPFKGASPTATVVAVATQPPPPMKKADGLELLISGLLNKAPDERLGALAALEKLSSWRITTKEIPKPAAAPDTLPNRGSAGVSRADPRPHPTKPQRPSQRPDMAAVRTLRIWAGALACVAVALMIGGPVAGSYGHNDLGVVLIVLAAVNVFGVLPFIAFAVRRRERGW